MATQSSLIQTLSESLNLNQTALNELRNVMGVSNLAFNTLTTSVNHLVNGVKEANDLQRQTLSIGKTLQQITAGNTQALVSLGGGFAENTQSLLELRRAGFDKLNPATVQLATFMKNTGQSTAGLVKLNQRLFSQGGLTENSLNTLSEDLGYTSQAYGVATEDLVDAVGGLAKNLNTFGQLGIAGPLTKVVTELTGRLGVTFKDQISAFTNLLADPKTSSTLLSKLGLFDIARDIRDNANVTPDAIMAAIRQASRATQEFTAGAEGQSGEVFQSLLAQVGGQGGLGQLGLILDRATLKPEGPESIISTQMLELGIIFREVMEPLKVLAAEILPPIVTFMRENIKLMRHLVVIAIPLLAGGLTLLATRVLNRMVVTAIQHYENNLKHMTLMGALGNLTGAVMAQTHTARAAAVTNRLSILGIVASIAVTAIGIFAANKKIADIADNAHKLEKDKFLDEQRRQATDIKHSNSFIALARAVSQDAGLALAFRPDLMDRAGRDDIARTIVDYLDDIAAGVHTPGGPVSISIGGSTP